MAAHRRASALLVIPAAAALLLGVPGPASAHDGLVATTPADGAVVAGPPEVELEFTAEPLPLGTQVAVTGPDGAPVTAGPAEIRSTSVVQALAADPAPGAYRVEWRSTSSDGHALSGAFSFTVTGDAGTGGAAAPAPAAVAAPAGNSSAGGLSPVWPVAGAVAAGGLAVLVVSRLRRRP